jgi:hypothetical protein
MLVRRGVGGAAIALAPLPSLPPLPPPPPPTPAAAAACRLPSCLPWLPCLLPGPGASREWQCASQKAAPELSERLLRAAAAAAAAAAAGELSVGPPALLRWAARKDSGRPLRAEEEEAEEAEEEVSERTLLLLPELLLPELLLPALSPIEGTAVTVRCTLERRGCSSCPPDPAAEPLPRVAEAPKVALRCRPEAKAEAEAEEAPRPMAAP